MGFVLRSLYYHPMSCSSKAVRLLLAEYDISYHGLIENLWEFREPFLRLSPSGVLPVLVESDDFAIVGGMVISEYLDETTGGKVGDLRLYPTTIESRCEMRRLCDFALSRFDSDICAPLVHERVTKHLMPAGKGGGPPDSEILRNCRSRLQGYLEYWGSLIDEREYLACDYLTFADLSTAACLCVLDYLGEIDWLDGSSLKTWYSRIKSRPSFRPLLSDRVQGVACVSHYVDLDF